MQIFDTALEVTAPDHSSAGHPLLDRLPFRGLVKLGTRRSIHFLMDTPLIHWGRVCQVSSVHLSQGDDHLDDSREIGHCIEDAEGSFSEQQVFNRLKPSSRPVHLS